MNDGAGANENMPVVHNGIIYLVNPGNIVQALDGRTGDLIWEHRLGPGQSGGHGLDAQQRDLRRQADRRHDRRAPGRRSTRGTAARSGRSPLGARRNQLLDHERTDCGEGQGHPGAPGLRPLWSRPLLHQRLRTRPPVKPLWKFYTIAHAGEPGGDTLGQDHRRLPQGRRDLDCRQLRSRFEPDLLGRRAGEAVDDLQPGQHGVRRVALLVLDAGPQRRHRQAGLAPPARPWRITRPRRGLRARARGHRRSEGRLLDWQGRACSGSSIAAPASSSATRRPSTRTSSTASIR